MEVDATFYRTPSPAMVKNWERRTPAGFTFAAKVPRSITHDKVMQDCDAELKEFLSAMDLLGASSMTMKSQRVAGQYKAIVTSTSNPPGSHRKICDLRFAICD